MRGVHVRDTNTNDNITIDKLPASDPNFPGGIEFDLEEERISLLTTGGDIYFFEPGLDLRLKEALVPEEPIIIEVLYQNSVAAEFYTAVNSDELVQIVDRGEIGLASEVVNDSDQDD